MKDQGYTVDLKISSDLKTLTSVWTGDTTITKAIRDKSVIAQGSSYLKKNIAFWLGTNYYANVKPGKRIRN